jgi:hypothetical protein
MSRRLKSCLVAKMPSLRGYSIAIQSSSKPTASSSEKYFNIQYIRLAIKNRSSIALLI